MPSLLAVDVGTQRIGIAIADAELRIAHPLNVVDRKEAEVYLLNIIQERDVTTVIFGLPLLADGREGGICQKVRQLAKRIAKRANVNTEFIDEYASSEEALELARASGNKPQFIDAHAAAVILRSYLELTNTP